MQRVRRVRSLPMVLLALVTLVGSTLAGTIVPGPVAAAEPPPTWVRTWGAWGTGNGQFQYPTTIAVNQANGDVYVADTRIQRFSSTGTFITSWAGGGGMAVEPTTGDVFVAGGNAVIRYTSSGTERYRWGKTGGGAGSLDGEFRGAVGVAVDPTPPGHVYVADTGNHRIQKFTLAGVHVATWGGPTAGTAAGRFNSPYGVAVSEHTGAVYVADTYNHRIQRFSSAGVHQATWGGTAPGVAHGRFDHPHGIAVNDANGSIYVADTYNERIQRLNATNGTFISTWGIAGDGPGEFLNPFGVAALAWNRHVYVVDKYNYTVQEFSDAIVPRARPDGRIQRGSTTVVGNNIYNTTGTNQTVSASAARGRSVVFYVSAQNDGNVNDQLRLRGQGSTTRFAVRYQDPWGADITAEVRSSGGHLTSVVVPTGTYRVKVTVTVLRAAPAGASLARTATVTSVMTPTAGDTVKFVTRRA